MFGRGSPMTVAGLLGCVLSLAAATAVPAQDSCFGEKPICRQVMGLDASVSNMTDADIKAQLNDRWALDVLRSGRYPLEISAILEVMADVSLQRGYTRRTFLVAEGGKLRAPPPDYPKDFRFVTHWSADDQPNLFLGTPPSGDRSTFLEVIAWDANKGAFNYYERNQIGEQHVWIWRGDTRHAFDPRTRTKGCLACHVAGTLVMKELERPWNNWNSEVSGIDSFPADFGMPATVQQNSLERLIRRGINFTAETRVDAANGSLSELLSPLLETRAANLVSSMVRSDFTGSPSDAMPFPVDFFLNVKAFNRLGLSIGSIKVDLPRAGYLAAVERLGFKLRRRESPFEQPGDTFFGALTPAMAVEDLVHLGVLLDRNLVTPEAAAALLMVDFPNPVFSPKRASLAPHLSGLTVADAAGTALLPRLVTLVEQATVGQPACNVAALDACSGEQQFLHYAKLAQSPGWSDAFLSALRDYTTAVGERLANDAGAADDYVALLAWRRQLFRGFRIAESPLLFPTVEQTVQPHSMTSSGKVIVAPQ